MMMILMQGKQSQQGVIGEKTSVSYGKWSRASMAFLERRRVSPLVISTCGIETTNFEWLCDVASSHVREACCCSGSKQLGRLHLHLGFYPWDKTTSLTLRHACGCKWTMLKHTNGPWKHIMPSSNRNILEGHHIEVAYLTQVFERLIRPILPTTIVGHRATTAPEVSKVTDRTPK